MKTRFAEIAPFALAPYVVCAVLYLAMPAYITPLFTRGLPPIMAITALVIWEMLGVAVFLKGTAVKKALIVPLFILPLTIAIMIGPLVITTATHY